MNCLRLACGMLVLIIITSGPAQAANMGNQPPFSEAELRKFLADFPKYSKWAEKHGEQFGVMDGPNAWEALGFNQELKGFLKSLGWQPEERFFYILGQVTTGLMGTMSSYVSPGVIGELEAKRDSILSNPKMSGAQKKNAIRRIEQAISDARRSAKSAPPRLPGQEMLLIKKYRDPIMKVFARSKGL